MPGLIPLMLNRTSVGFSSQRQPHARGRSVGQLCRSPPPPPPPQPPKRASMPVPSRPTKRLSSSLPSALPVLPYSASDWRRAIAEVKRQHMNRRYRACFTRCDEILENIKDTSNIEPAYLISLHFYAATAMEMCARPITRPSAYRDSLLDQARRHYDQANAFIRTAEESLVSKSRPSSFMSTSSSLHSPSGSICSRAWTAETDISSPTPSVCSSEEMNARCRQSGSPPILSPTPQPARKKVSFELPKDAPVRLEPFIRPDSPTLGFDDEYFTAALARTELPEIPKQKTPEPAWIPAEEQSTPPKDHAFGQNVFDASHDHIRDSFLLGASAIRYCAHLESLKSQVALHKASLEAVLEMPFSEEDIVSRASTPISDEMRDIGRQARIERLRKSGWQRKRFDPTRYEALRSAVLAELD